ncbi:MAG TPA: DinB family protein [Ktedonobacteraceae bacterium]|nr:DinB family protein [Ktedonobacteraceae bacterium]
MLSLTTFYAGWSVYQQRLAAAIAPLEGSQLALRASSHTWTVGRIAAHIVAARVWWFYARAGEGAGLIPDEQWNAMERWDGASATGLDTAELIRGLELTWHMIESALQRWTPTDLEYVFASRPEDTAARSRQWIVWHVLEHDVFHGGEISCILGAHGLAAIALE